MIYNFMKTYLLSQQTPLIHFQYDQEGATLRATEVKPKLDQYLIQRFKADNPGKTIPDNWWINPEKDKKTGEVIVKALNYRMTITCSNVEVVDFFYKRPQTKVSDYDIFYGNQGTNTIKKHGVYANDIFLKIICLDERLRNYIDDCIVGFFITHNFGTMQSKGFGSFIVTQRINGSSAEKIENSKKMIVDELCFAYGKKICYSFPSGNRRYPGEGKEQEEQVFKRIKTIYSIMKSGLNFAGYRRSLLFLYMHRFESKGNEKYWLKQQKMAPYNVGLHTRQAKEWEETQAHTPYYVRALLGTTEKIEFLNDLADRQNKTAVKISHPAIKRFSSPIFFKVIKNTVYYIGKNINSDIFDQEFTFSSPYDGWKTKTLPVPRVPDSFTDRFLEFCFTELNKNQAMLNRDYPDSNYQAMSSFPNMTGVVISRHERSRQNG